MRFGLDSAGGTSNGGLGQFRLSQNGRCLASNDANHRPDTVFVYTVNDPAVFELTHTYPVVSFEFNPTPLKPALMTLDSQGTVRFWKQRDFLARVGASVPVGRDVKVITPGITIEPARPAPKDDGKAPSDKVLDAQLSQHTFSRGRAGSVDLSASLAQPDQNYFANPSLEPKAGEATTTTTATSTTTTTTTASADSTSASTATPDATSSTSTPSSPTATSPSTTTSTTSTTATSTSPLAVNPAGEVKKEDPKSPSKNKSQNQQSTQWFLAGELFTQPNNPMFVGCAWVCDSANEVEETNPLKPGAKQAKLSSRLITMDLHGTATMWDIAGLMNDNTVRPEVVYTLHQSWGSGGDMVQQVMSRARLFPISNTGKGVGEMCKITALTQKHALRAWTIATRPNRVAKSDKGEVSVQNRLRHSLGGHLLMEPSLVVESVVSHSTLPFVATLANDRRVVVWQVASPQIMQPSPCSYLCSFDNVPYYGMAWSPATLPETHMLLFCLGSAVIDVYYFHPDADRKSVV